MQSDKLKEYIDDLMIHKKYMIDSCKKMVDWLYEQGEEVLAMELVERALVHDNSKFTDEELDTLGKLYETKSSLVNPDYILNDDDKQCIMVHWKNNRHHPEFHDKITDMTEVDILEMVCDWHSRSTQHGTDLLEFVDKRQNNRFRFPQDMYKTILKYCNIIIKL